MLAAFLLLVSTPADFSSNWRGLPDRVWVGPDTFQNCLQDWRVRDGRVECMEGRENLPARTLQLLTRTLDSAPGTFATQVLIGQVAPVDPNPASWVGVQFGQGGPDVDYRITALVHHQPAEDGGVIAVIDGTGRVHLRDFSQTLDNYGPWSLSGSLNPQRVPEFPATARVDTGFVGRFEPVVLRVEATPVGDAYRVRVVATRAIGRTVVSEATYDGIPAHQVDGGVALFSHLGPSGQEATCWFDAWTVSGSKVRRSEQRAFGPVLGAQYTTGAGLLKLTAQFPPLAQGEDRTARLELWRDGGWRETATATLDPDAFTAGFRVEGYEAERDTPYRIVFQGAPVWRGTVRAEPKGREFVLAALTCAKIYTGHLHWNGRGIWTPHADIVSGVRANHPDLVYFSGDEIYEGDLTPARRQPEDEAFLDYLYKWSRFLWAFGDLMRDVPSITLPDDHDVYHGNLWGAGGKKAEALPGITAQDSGGYLMPPRFVNAVHRTQTSHLPDPVDPAPCGIGISVYFTRLEYGGVSFAILGDRQFKSSPTMAVPAGKFENGWPQAEGFDPAKEADVPGASLLGERQERFLAEWAEDWSHGAWMKVVLSQSPFTNVATLPKDDKSGEAIPNLPVYEKGDYPPDDRPVADGDSNGWPQTARNRALRLIRSAYAVHVTGDQHLGTLVQYGVDAFRDAGYAFCTPAIGNTWPRRWMPAERGANQGPGAPRYTGDYVDGFGNRMTVWAAANPYQTHIEPTALHDRVPGFGVVVFDRWTRAITFECWPRWAFAGRGTLGPGDGLAKAMALHRSRPQQFDGWPRTVMQEDNYLPRGHVRLPEIVVEGLRDPVVQVMRGAEVVSTMRIQGQRYRPWAPGPGTYTVRVGEPDRGLWKLVMVEPDPSGARREVVDFR